MVGDLVIETVVKKDQGSGFAGARDDLVKGGRILPVSEQGFAGIAGPPFDRHGIGSGLLKEGTPHNLRVNLEGSRGGGGVSEGVGGKDFEGVDSSFDEFREGDLVVGFQVGVFDYLVE